LKTIFIIDDCDTNLVKAEEILEDHFRTFTFSSADKMFAFLEKIIPDLILLDIEMPVMNGFEALERLKSDNSKANIPVFFLTATVNASIEERSAKLGAVGIISKSFSPAELLDRINSVI
jgi:CheY-like chemotaxis protein